MEINKDRAQDRQPPLRTRSFPFPPGELAEPRPGIVVNDDAALVECLDTDRRR
ncbi:MULTISPECIES: hypothetical protein [Saccharopolyspora]|uniref:Uncharacterized protein n=1 Tax=Saccharopolyspora gregorii TaxID=33914 RepID=A0ABP6RWQ6_9PSEU|nr:MULTISPECIES: hypothetical protein [Saccharopolyspora]MCA1192714.1 hypothetical protein [Saccharopolyspora sp. 6V]MCA1227948.1 hypothetical protein [Saccharopolyspora sp. 6M]MCA1280455.1 hypothetical protein [Saccharopolyspora sp. 7B]